MSSQTLPKLFKMYSRFPAELVTFTEEFFRYSPVLEEVDERYKSLIRDTCTMSMSCVPDEFENFLGAVYVKGYMFVKLSMKVPENNIYFSAFLQFFVYIYLIATKPEWYVKSSALESKQNITITNVMPSPNKKPSDESLEAKKKGSRKGGRITDLYYAELRELAQEERSRRGMTDWFFDEQTFKNLREKAQLKADQRYLEELDQRAQRAKWEVIRDEDRPSRSGLFSVQEPEEDFYERDLFAEEDYFKDMQFYEAKSREKSSAPEGMPIERWISLLSKQSKIINDLQARLQEVGKKTTPVVEILESKLPAPIDVLNQKLEVPVASVSSKDDSVLVTPALKVGSSKRKRNRRKKKPAVVVPVVSESKKVTEKPKISVKPKSLVAELKERISSPSLRPQQPNAKKTEGKLESKLVGSSYIHPDKHMKSVIPLYVKNGESYDFTCTGTALGSLIVTNRHGISNPSSTPIYTCKFKDAKSEYYPLKFFKGSRFHKDIVYYRKPDRVAVPSWNYRIPVTGESTSYFGFVEKVKGTVEAIISPGTAPATHDGQHWSSTEAGCSGGAIAASSDTFCIGIHQRGKDGGPNGYIPLTPDLIAEITSVIPGN